MRTSSELPVTLSVLDRLIDVEPAQLEEAPLSRTQSLRKLRSAVRRDLEWLLNSRRIPVEPDPAFVEVNQSVYVSGLEDFATFSLADGQEQSRLLHHIQTVIRQFEPRLANVQISQQDDPIKTRRMRFRIEASLLVDPAPERISFDTVLQLSSGEYVINEVS
jgi:type VI secretion system protein ImpF